MRTTLTLVLLAAILAAPVLADGKASKKAYAPPRGMDVTEMMATPQAPLALPTFGFQGAVVHSRMMSADGFYCGLDPQIFRPLIFPVIEKWGGIPTRDARQASVIGEWTFYCYSPTQTYLSGDYNGRRNGLGLNLNNEKFIVRLTVIFYENTIVGQGETIDDFSCGRLVAGPFVSQGKANAATSWQAFLNTCSWTRSLNLSFGQEEWSDDKLQFAALVKSFANLRPIRPATPTLPY